MGIKRSLSDLFHHFWQYVQLLSKKLQNVFVFLSLKLLLLEYIVFCSPLGKTPCSVFLWTLQLEKM